MAEKRFDDLVEALRCLPGIGPKSAQRMAFHLLERDREGAERLAERLLSAVAHVGRCRQCRTLSEAAVCALCADDTRSDEQLCVVETPSDVLALQRATEYRGRYFVLLGHLSPLDGIGPEALGLDQLEARLASGDVKEVILATGSTVEGQATAHYISELAKNHGVGVMRLAQGVPLGGELEYVDGGTLSIAFAARTQVD